MKIDPKKYAEALIESIEPAASRRADLKAVAKNFWHTLQRNGQYAKLPQVLAALNDAYTKKTGQVIAKVYSPEKIDLTQTKEITSKLKNMFGKEVIINNIINANLSAGIVVKVGDKAIDLSLNGKVERLKKKLTS